MGAFRMIYKTSDVLFPDRSENMHLYNSDVQVLFSDAKVCTLKQRLRLHQ